jgi:hypothetical protein
VKSSLLVQLPLFVAAEIRASIAVWHGTHTDWVGAANEIDQRTVHEFCCSRWQEGRALMTCDFDNGFPFLEPFRRAIKGAA